MADQLLDLDDNDQTDALTVRPVLTALHASTAITKANPAVLTVAGSTHTVVAGDTIIISGDAAMTEINTTHTLVASVTATTITTTGIDSSLFTTSTGGGQVEVVSAVDGDVRVLYDDSKTKSQIIDSLQRAKEKLIETLTV